MGWWDVNERLKVEVLGLDVKWGWAGTKSEIKNGNVKINVLKIP